MSNQTSWQSASWSSVISTHHTLYIFGCNLLFKLYYRLWHELFCRYENSFSIAFKRLVHPKKENSLIIYWPSCRSEPVRLSSSCCSFPCNEDKFGQTLSSSRSAKKHNKTFIKYSIQLSTIFQLIFWSYTIYNASAWWFLFITNSVMNGHISSAEHVS